MSSEQISDLLDGNGPRELAYGTFFGFISSSCSYSAVATAKNFFKKGASAAAALGFTYVVPDEVIETARENAVGDEDLTEQDPVCGMEVNPEETEYTTEHDGQTYYFCSQSCKDSFDSEEANTTIRDSATSIEGWKGLADKQYKEWGMLWEDILVGFVFAGVLSGFVPDVVWTALFANEILELPAFVVWTTILGALIGITTFVCSVGNVPFATILWTKGLSFGRVLSYIFADLIIPPLMDAYREYYGGTFAAILSGMIFVCAVLAGLVVYVIFAGLGLIPPRAGTQIAETSIELDNKAVLNLLATGLFVVLYYLHRESSMESRAGGGQGSTAD